MGSCVSGARCSIRRIKIQKDVEGVVFGDGLGGDELGGEPATWKVCGMWIHVSE